MTPDDTRRCSAARGDLEWADSVLRAPQPTIDELRRAANVYLLHGRIPEAGLAQSRQRCVKYRRTS